MSKLDAKVSARLRRRIRVKKRIRADRGITRLCVFRSNRHLYVQLIDDIQGKVLTSVASEEHNNLAAAKEIGTAIAELAKKMSIDKICFDRNGYRYHGRIKAIADAAREAGLKF